MMKAFIYVFPLLMLLPAAIRAEDLRLESGRELKEIRMLEKGVDYVRLAHQDGIAWIRAEELPAAYQHKWEMTPDRVSERRRARQQQLAEKREQEEKKLREVREALAESQRHPRYINAHELSSLYAPFLPINPIEAEYLAARWNAQEAKRLGDRQMQEQYSARVTELTPHMSRLVLQKQEDRNKLEEMEKRLALLSTESRNQSELLKKQIRNLQSDLSSQRDEARRTTVIYQPTTYREYVYDNGRPCPRPIVRPPAIVRPPIVIRPGTNHVIKHPPGIGPRVVRPPVAPVVRPTVVR